MTNDEKLLYLWEERHVQKVLLRFGRSLDIGDWAGLRACFTNPLNIDFQRLTGQPEVRVDADLWTQFTSLFQNRVRRHHVYTNFDITINGDSAHALVYMTARHWRTTDLGVSHNTEYGWYVFWLERHDAGWLIAKVKHDFQWVTSPSSSTSLSTSSASIPSSARAASRLDASSPPRPMSIAPNCLDWRNVHAIALSIPST